MPAKTLAITSQQSQDIRYLASGIWYQERITNNGNSSAPIAFSLISAKGRNLQDFSLAQTLAQTGFFSLWHGPASVAPGRAGRAHSFEITTWAELLSITINETCQIH
jgi:hypothetical protein